VNAFIGGHFTAFCSALSRRESMAGLRNNDWSEVHERQQWPSRRAAARLQHKELPELMESKDKMIHGSAKISLSCNGRQVHIN
jgi:hypothetical protein